MAARQLHYQRLYQVQQLQLQAHYQHVQRQQLQQQLWQQQQQQRPFIQHGQAVVEGGLGGADTHVESLAISQGNQGFFPGSSSRTTLVESETTHGSSPILALAPSREIETAARDVEMGQVPEMMLRGMSLSREEERASLLSLAAGQMNGPELADYHLDVVHGSDKLSLIPSPSPSPSSSSSTSTSSASSSSSTTPSLPSLKSVSTIAQDACQFGSGMPINVETAEVQLVQPSFNLTAVAGIDSDAEKCVALLDKNIVQETAVGASACAAGYRNDDDDDDDDTVSTVTDAKTHASTDQVHSVKGDEDDEEEDAEGGDGYGASHGSPTEEEDEDGGDDRDDNE
ncbi:hypothetical protein BGW38_008942 [Lunasporangiospora selenospora]|uniref:Uncharacterized protein n=1 Tax=Lunasporangiospora selenospora TaxID=979761 RepID=A0A9P6KG40_9FUNG|nr:hypothetical protein BGW38_008942 [Lunasporangiospora selenospora]